MKIFHRASESLLHAVSSIHVSADLGSTRVVAEQNGDMVSRPRYLPVGQEYTHTSTDQNSTGHERYKATGLDYMMARYYSPETAFRFASFDASRLGVDRRSPQTWNGYTYVLNQPIGNIDPNGLYQTNFHQGWTYMLAKQAGFSESEARTISRSNSGVDKGWSKAFWSKGNRRNKHGFCYGQCRDDALDGALATTPGDFEQLGKALHHFQDTFSHEDFGPVLGQAVLGGGKAPDFTSDNPGKAVDAASQSFDILKQKAEELGKKGFGAPDEGLLNDLAVADVTDFDPTSGNITLEVSADKVDDLVKSLKAKGYTVEVDGVVQ